MNINKTFDHVIAFDRMTREASPKSFKQLALTRLQQITHFDSAVWIEGRTDGYIYPHATHLFNQPMEMLANYQQYAPQDGFRDFVEANPGKIIDPFDLVSKEEFSNSELYQKHCKLFDLEAALGMALPVPNLSIYSFITLYRGKASPLFNTEDKESLEEFIPHMVDCYRTSVYIGALSSTCAHNSFTIGTAVVDQFGYIYDATHGFRTQTIEQDNGWSTPKIPEPLWAELDKNHRAVTEDLVFKMIDIENDMNLVNISPTPKKWMVLGRSEQKIALQLARGLSYKEIARIMNLSTSTITNHANKIYAKLEIDSKTKLAQHLTTLLD